MTVPETVHCISPCDSEDDSPAISTRSTAVSRNAPPPRMLPSVQMMMRMGMMEHEHEHDNEDEGVSSVSFPDVASFPDEEDKDESVDALSPMRVSMDSIEYGSNSDTSTDTTTARSSWLSCSGMTRTKSFKSNLCALDTDATLAQPVKNEESSSLVTASSNLDIDEICHYNQQDQQLEQEEGGELTTSPSSCWGFFVESSNISSTHARLRSGGGKYGRLSIVQHRRRQQQRISQYFVPIQNHNANLKKMASNTAANYVDNQSKNDAVESFFKGLCI